VLDVLDGRTNSLDNSEDIKKQLMSLSDNKIKFVDNKVNIEPIDFSKELETVKNFINKIEQEYGTNIKEILNSKVDNKKLLIKNTINNFQKQFSNKLKSLVNSGNFGDYEGLVISLYNGIIFKVISDNFTRNKKEKKK
jgi:Na+/phosphate symporter